MFVKSVNSSVVLFFLEGSTRYYFLNVFLLLICMLPAGATTNSIETVCANATVADLNQVHRGYSSDSSVVVRLDVLEPGMIVVETSPPWQHAVPRMEYFHGCHQAFTNDVETVERKAASIVLRVRTAGTHYFRLGAQDPQQMLGDYRLSNHFLPSLSKTNGEDDSDPGEGVPSTTGEDDSDPGEGVPSTTGEDDSDPGEGLLTKTGEDDSDPGEGQAAEGLPRGTREVLCQQGERDDHSDLLTCATPMMPGIEVTGDIGNPSGDDSDVFFFDLEEFTSVRIDSMSEFETTINVYNHSGQQLSHPMGEIRTMPPGRYYIRVSSKDSFEGFFKMKVELLEW